MMAIPIEEVAMVAHDCTDPPITATAIVAITIVFLFILFYYLKLICDAKHKSYQVLH